VDDRDTASDWSAPVGAALSLGAAAIHFAVVGEHFLEYALFGILFAALAWFQAGWALWFAVRPGPRAAFIAVVVNVGVLLVWSCSRTIGLPVGPEPWSREPVGALDLAASALEVALVALLVWRLRQADRLPTRRPRPASVLAATTAIAVVAIVTTSVLAASGGSAHPVDHSHPTVAAATSGADAPEGGAAATLQPGRTPTVSPGEDEHLVSPHAHRSPTSEPSSTPPSPASTALLTEPGTIVFGADLDAAGRITEPAERFPHSTLAVWIVTLSRPAPEAGLEFVVIARLSDGREIPHWTEAVDDVHAGQRTIVSAGRLSDFAHGGTGTYVMRYMAGEQVLAEGRFTLTP
jgi:hypothetical protein